MTNEEKLIENLEKIRDFNINEIPNSKLASYYQIWIDQIYAKNIYDSKLKFWIENQADYYQPKDRSYSNFLRNLIK